MKTDDRKAPSATQELERGLKDRFELLNFTVDVNP
jgi:hypothetical protein